MNNFDRRHIAEMTAPFGPDTNHGFLPGDRDSLQTYGSLNDASIAKAHAASIALAIKGASEAVTTELDSIDHRLGQVLVGLDQLKRIVDRLDKISERIDAVEEETA
jgi:hypothetical protein